MKRIATTGLLLIIVLTLGGLTLISFGGTVWEDSLMVDDLQDDSLVAYTPHDWVNIIGNDDFLTQAALEGWPGLGTEESPIIIEGLSFSGSGHMFRAIQCDIFFEFRNNRLDGIDTAWCGFYMSDAANAKIYDNIIVNSAIPFHVINLNNSIFENNILYDNGNVAFAFELLCVGNVIKDNQMFDNLGGIWLDWNNTDNLIIDNHIYDNAGTGIGILDDAHNNLIINNTIIGNSLNGIFSRGYGNTITGNIISNNTQNGILLAHGNGHLISENIIQNNRRCGISIYSFVHSNYENNMTHNSILDNGQYGVKIWIGCDSNTITWNNFINNFEPLQASDKGTNNEFKYNYWNPWNNTDENEDSFVDFPYLVESPENNTDDYPLASPTAQLPSDYIYTPNLPATIVVPTHEETSTATNETITGSPEFPLVELALIAGVSCAVIIIIGVVLKQRRGGI